MVCFLKITEIFEFMWHNVCVHNWLNKNISQPYSKKNIFRMRRQAKYNTEMVFNLMRSVQMYKIKCEII